MSTTMSITNGPGFIAIRKSGLKEEEMLFVPHVTYSIVLVLTRIRHFHLKLGTSNLAPCIQWGQRDQILILISYALQMSQLPFLSSMPPLCCCRYRSRIKTVMGNFWFFFLFFYIFFNVYMYLI